MAILTGIVGLPLLVLALFVWLGPGLIGGPSPAPSDLQTSAVVRDRDGRLLRVYTAADGRWRLPATRADVDPRFVEMLLAYEDKRYQTHFGVDARAMARAAWQAVTSLRIVSGGSTLTMQVARLIDGGGTRTLSGKLRQILRALRLERALSKDQILALYLARAPYGGNIEGIAAASLAYFGKLPARLSVGEAALLVALPQAPEARRPDRNQDGARGARTRVLERMVLAGVISQGQAEAGVREPLPDRRRPFPMLAAHAADRARSADPSNRSHRLTIDRDLQSRLEVLARAYAGRFGDARSLAIVVADHASGEILASVGSPDYLDARYFGAIDMTRAIRSPGSTLKPLIYGLAFEEGLAHPRSLIEDRPLSIAGYAPKNFDLDYRGTVTVGDALALSLNVPAVTLLDAVGPTRLLARLRKAGAHVELPPGGQPGLAIGLGGLGVSLHDLVALYAAIGRGGEPVLLREREDGADTLASASGMDPVLSKLASWYVADILARTPPPRHAIGGRIAFKTGTSYGYRDAWALGFDGRYVIGVWTGRPDGGPVAGATGYTAAAPILFDSFNRLGRALEPLRSAPRGVLTGAATSLPEPLRRVRGHRRGDVARRSALQIAYPPNGSLVDLGLSDGGASRQLLVKVARGNPPFIWFANGKPIGAPAFRRALAWTPDGPGFTRLSVIDAAGGSASISVQLK